MADDTHMPGRSGGRSIRIAAFSGAVGDHAGALADAAHGEPVDVPIGDFLAEFMMARVIGGLHALPQPLPTDEKTLLGLRQDVRVERHALPNVRGMMFVLKGYFGPSGSGNIGLDPIGKGVGEFLRARLVDVPADLLETS